MLLPSPAIRAALRLDTPAKRFVWASEQLFGALFPAAAVIASPILGIPAKPLAKGIAPTNLMIEKLPVMSIFNQAGVFSPNFYLPFNNAQFYRGVPLLLCIGELVSEIYQPHVGAIVAGAAIPDGSAMLTFEQYIVEQLSYMITQSVDPVDFDYTVLAPQILTVDLTPYSKRQLSVLEVASTVYRSGFVGNNRYGDIQGIATL